MAKKAKSKAALPIAEVREQLDKEQLAGPAFVIYAAQVAPFSLIGLAADGRNYLTQSIPVAPGQQFVAVPLNPAPATGSEIWWAVLPATNILGLAAVLIEASGRKRLLGRKNAVARAEVWSGSSIV